MHRTRQPCMLTNEFDCVPSRLSGVIWLGGFGKRDEPLVMLWWASHEDIFVSLFVIIFGEDGQSGLGACFSKELPSIS